MVTNSEINNVYQKGNLCCYHLYNICNKHVITIFWDHTRSIYTQNGYLIKHSLYVFKPPGVCPSLSKPQKLMFAQ